MTEECWLKRTVNSRKASLNKHPYTAQAYKNPALIFFFINERKQRWNALFLVLGQLFIQHWPRSSKKNIVRLLYFYPCSLIGRYLLGTILFCQLRAVNARTQGWLFLRNMLKGKASPNKIQKIHKPEEATMHYGLRVEIEEILNVEK